MSSRSSLKVMRCVSWTLSGFSVFPCNPCALHGSVLCLLPPSDRALSYLEWEVFSTGAAVWKPASSSMSHFSFVGHAVASVFCENLSSAWRISCHVASGTHSLRATSPTRRRHRAPDHISDPQLVEQDFPSSLSGVR